MKCKKINIEEKFSKFDALWTPKVIAQMNDFQFKLVRIKDDFIWHSHKETDEVFLVIEGEMTIFFRDGKLLLKAGELVSIPMGVEHKTESERGCKIMIVEKSGVINTGASVGNLTAPIDDWI
tara:strand:+ start:1229 stop:1594 length:366 start_codon:yes stop_codon:yes gene_type:complete